MNNIDSYLDNLAAAETQEKDVLEQLVNSNTNLITQLIELTKKFEQLSCQDNSSNSSGAHTINGKMIKFVKHNKDGHFYTHGHRCLQNHSSRNCSRPGSNHKKDATREDTKGGSTKNKDYVCSYYEDKGFWVPHEQRN